MSSLNFSLRRNSILCQWCGLTAAEYRHSAISNDSCTKIG